MKLNANHARNALTPLLGPDDPPPYEIINPDGKAQTLLICDHASRRVPALLGDLGLSPDQYERHIAYDIGAEAVTRKLSRSLDCIAVIAGYSRLVLDVNRPPGHPGLIPKSSDGMRIPANQKLSEPEIDQRIQGLHAPYHEGISHALGHLWNRGPAPALFSVHSFTPNYGDEDRPWDVGILWKHDPRIALPMMEHFRARGMNVGDNKPYSALDLAFTIDAHAGSAGLASVVLEIRQDQITDDNGVQRWADILHHDLGAIMDNDDLYQVREY